MGAGVEGLGGGGAGGRCRLVWVRIRVLMTRSGQRARSRESGPEGRVDCGGEATRAIRLPAIAEAREPRPALAPADMQRMRPLEQPAGAQAESQVATGVVRPAEQPGAPEAVPAAAAPPHRGRPR